MRQVMRFALLAFFCSLVWCILRASFSLTTILTGAALGTAAVVSSRFFLLPKAMDLPPPQAFRFKPLLFPFCLLFTIYSNGFKIIRLFFRGHTHIGLAKFATGLSSPLLNYLLANAITLTPGTVTLDMQSDTLTVLCLDCPHKTDPASAKKKIAGWFFSLFGNGDGDA
jgi:multicomponent Na+:H+ antiporter subunit E